MEEIIRNHQDVNGLLTDIRQVLQEARNHIARTVNTTLVNTYWQVGRHIVEYEQGGAERAEYSKGVINYLAEHLTRDFGAGFNATNLRLMRRLFICFPNQRTLSVKLSWSHYNYLLKVENKTARDFYLAECEVSGWSVRQLQRQINTMYYERLLSSRDTMIRYTLPEGQSQIFAAQYMTYMPSKEELQKLLTE
ncbi:MAG: DUF1016 N-terminal domain-containing protein [Bacteroidales bacterium]|nr:DUF1016 N-terminal domain-containing protein [Bacteroidales bacterium]